MTEGKVCISLVDVDIREQDVDLVVGWQWRNFLDELTETLVRERIQSAEVSAESTCGNVGASQTIGWTRFASACGIVTVSADSEEPTILDTLVRALIHLSHIAARLALHTGRIISAKVAIIRTILASLVLSIVE